MSSCRVVDNWTLFLPLSCSWRVTQLQGYTYAAVASGAARIRFDVYGSHGKLAREDQPPEYVPLSQIGKLGKTAYTCHGGQLNMLFCDGHLEAMGVQTLFFSKDDRDLRLWNSDNEPHRDRLYKSPH